MEAARREKELEVEMERIKRGVVSDPAPKSKEVQAKLPKLPHFVDGKDNIDAYLKRFERFAENAHWDKTHWATNLSALLTGKALDVYSRLSAEDAIDYDKLKESLLKRFQLTEEGFRLKFRSSKMETGETAQQFIVRLDDYVMRWMQLGKVEATFEGIKDLIIREQFMKASSKNLQVFLKERKCDSAAEMASFADQYLEAHDFVADPSKELSKGKIQNMSLCQSPEKIRQCYNCRSTTHLARDCPELVQVNHSNEDRFSHGDRYPQGEPVYPTKSDTYHEHTRGRGMVRRNFSGRGSHRGGLARGGPFSQNRGQHGKTDSGREDIGAFLQEKGKSGEETVVCSFKVIPDSEGSEGGSKTMPVAKGYLNGTKVSVLRDSGCSGVVTRRSLVTKDCMTGETQKCTLIDGTVRRFPIATVFIDSPYFTGKTTALCTEHPTYDVIIGNVTGARNPGTVDQDWKKDIQDNVEKGRKVIEESKGELASHSLEAQEKTEEARCDGNKGRVSRGKGLEVLQEKQMIDDSRKGDRRVSKQSEVSSNDERQSLDENHKKSLTSKPVEEVSRSRVSTEDLFEDKVKSDVYKRDEVREKQIDRSGLERRIGKKLTFHKAGEEYTDRERSEHEKIIGQERSKLTECEVVDRGKTNPESDKRKS